MLTHDPHVTTPSTLEVPQHPLQISTRLTPPVPNTGRGKATTALALPHLNQHLFAHSLKVFQLAEKPIKYLCGTLVETELALPLLPHHRPEMGRMKLIPSTQLLSSPSFQILNAIVMVLPLMWDLQLLCPCCICKCHLQ